jgi:hypothetical protein
MTTTTQKTKRIEPDDKNLVWMPSVTEESAVSRQQVWRTDNGLLAIHRCESKLKDGEPAHFIVQVRTTVKQHGGGMHTFWQSLCRDPDVSVEEGELVSGTYPRRYRSLDAALDAAEAVHKIQSGEEDFTSNRDKVVGEATKAGAVKALAVDKAPPPKPVEAKPKTTGQLSMVDAAIKVLHEANGPLTCLTMIGFMESKGYWKTTTGKTPAQTLAARICDDLKRGEHSRFVKVSPGVYDLRNRTIGS